MSEDSPGAAASQAAAAVTASLLPFGCAYGCAISLLWIIGGLLLGLVLTHLLQLRL